MIPENEALLTFELPEPSAAAELADLFVRRFPAGSSPEREYHTLSAQVETLLRVRGLRLSDPFGREIKANVRRPAPTLGILPPKRIPFFDRMLGRPERVLGNLIHAGGTNFLLAIHDSEHFHTLSLLAADLRCELEITVWAALTNQEKI